jgi:hypothetical protein
MVGLLIVGEVSTLFVSVCDPVRVVTELGNVGVPPIVYVPIMVPLKVGPEIVGEVMALFVSVCVSLRPTGPEAKLRKVLRLIL